VPTRRSHIIADAPSVVGTLPQRPTRHAPASVEHVARQTPHVCAPASAWVHGRAAHAKPSPQSALVAQDFEQTSSDPALMHVPLVQ
jgi:hypothetical protein